MSDKVWITARSEVIPFEELPDEHLDNNIAWCDIRLRSLEKSAKTAAKVIRAHRDEIARVKDLKVDLEREQHLRDRRRDTIRE